MYAVCFHQKLIFCDVKKMLGMHDEVIVATYPCKDNNQYNVFPFRYIAETFSPMLGML